MCKSCIYLLPVLVFSFMVQTCTLVWGTFKITAFMQSIEHRVDLMEESFIILLEEHKEMVSIDP